MSPKHPHLGLKWKALDLHVHTPASRDYTGPAITPEQFVQTALGKNVDGIAITDHNSGGWIDRIMDAASSTRLAVFPAVEITASSGEGGIHIIGLFDRTANCKTIENLLARIRIPSESYGQIEAISPMSVIDVVNQIAELGGLAILAHADSTKGVLRDMRGQQRIQLMQSPKVAAVELCDFSKSSRFVDGSDADYQRKIAAYRGSDNPNPAGPGHSAEGIGFRFSWFKMDGLTLDAIRQCFCDPDVRIIPEPKNLESPDAMYPRILEMGVTQGFLSGAPFYFHEGLNSIIGGKGVGKSLVVEFLRFGLDQASPLPDVADVMLGKLDGQLGYGGSVKIAIQVESGKTIQVERLFDNAAGPISITEIETGRKIHANIKELFPILAYSQTEALEIAKDPTAQLSLIDGFIDKTGLARRIDEIRLDLRSKDIGLARALTAQEDHDRFSREAATSAELIGQIDRALKSDKHDELRALIPKTEGLSALADAAEELEASAEAFTTQLEDLPPPELRDELKGDKEFKKLHSDTIGLLREMVQSARLLESKAKRLDGRIETGRTAWQRIVEKKEQEYLAWATKQGGDRTQLRKKRQAEERNRERAEKAVKAAKVAMSTLTALEDSRKELLDELDRLDLKLHELRVAKYAEISALSGGRLQLSVQRASNRDRYYDELCNLKKGSNIHDSTVREVVEKILPRAFVQSILSDDAAGLVAGSGISEKQAKRFVEFLRSIEDRTRLLALQHEMLVQDDPNIRFRKSDDNYHELSKISIGQKCTALMIIALAEGSRPVVIDQPEDALDTPSVYEDITRQLRLKKGQRQFVITTHNSTVAVAADSDEFHVMHATATEGSVMTAGALDRPKVVAAVIQHLEGGREPFALRNRKYSPAPT